MERHGGRAQVLMHDIDQSKDLEMCILSHEIRKCKWKLDKIVLVIKASDHPHKN